MQTIHQCMKLVLSFEEAYEEPHFGKDSFRIRKNICHAGYRKANSCSHVVVSASNCISSNVWCIGVSCWRGLGQTRLDKSITTVSKQNDFVWACRVSLLSCSAKKFKCQPCPLIRINKLAFDFLIFPIFTKRMFFLQI